MPRYGDHPASWAAGPWPLVICCCAAMPSPSLPPKLMLRMQPGVVKGEGAAGPGSPLKLDSEVRFLVKASCRSRCH